MAQLLPSMHPTPTPSPSPLPSPKTLQTTFLCRVKNGSLAATPDIGPTFGSFSIITESLLHHTEIDQDDDLVPETAVSVPVAVSDPDPDITPRNLPPPGPLKGYEYTSFQPQHESRTLSGHIRTSPTLYDANAALGELGLIIRPKRKKGAGYLDPDLDLWTRARLEGMVSMLGMYTNVNSKTYNNWGASALQAAIAMGRGIHCARRLRELCRGYITDRKILPVNPYGDWNESYLVDENLCNEISIYLLSIGNQISAKKLMDFLHQPDIKEKYGIERNISHKTACRYLQTLGYRYKATPKGQYVDGHERDDVVYYRENVFLPQWRRYQERMARWEKKVEETEPRGRRVTTLEETAPPGPGRRVITWFHDESVFYAHDR
jgi:hypothetical protein